MLLTEQHYCENTLLQRLYKIAKQQNTLAELLRKHIGSRSLGNKVTRFCHFGSKQGNYKPTWDMC